jgi:uncharacterized protein
MRTLTSLMLGLALISSAEGWAATNDQNQAPAKATFLVIYRPGPAWLVGKSVSEQPLKDHGKYMLNLYVNGLMMLAGPLTDNAGGAVVLTVADDAKAKEIVANDPAVRSGIFVYEMHPWELKPWDRYAKTTTGAK